MSVGKACLGFATRTDAVRALRAEGLDTNAIAARIGISTKNVSSLEASARRQERGPSRRQPAVVREQATGAIAELFPFHVRDRLRQHAAARDMSCVRLLQELIDRVLDDDLVDAVMDDGKSGGRA